MMNINTRREMALLCLVLIGSVHVLRADNGAPFPIAPAPTSDTTDPTTTNTSTTTSTTTAPPATTTTAAPTTNTSTASTSAVPSITASASNTTIQPATIQPTNTGTPVTNEPTSSPTPQTSTPSASPTPGSNGTGSTVSPDNTPTVPDSPQTTLTNGTTPAPTTTTPRPTTPAPTLPPLYPTKKPEKPFSLDFTIGSTPDSAVCCSAANCTFSMVESGIQDAFSTIPGYLYVTEGSSNAKRRRRAVDIQVAVLFDQQQLTALSAEERAKDINSSLTEMNNVTYLHVNMSKASDGIAALFVQADVCKTPGTCTTGYSCRDGACHHLCADYDCGDHGTCQVTVNNHGVASLSCLCTSDADHTYYGEKCQNEETSKAKVAAIVGGVLGSLCAVLLIILIFLCCRMRSDNDEGLSGKYQMDGNTNNGYRGQQFAMNDRP